MGATASGSGRHAERVFRVQQAMTELGPGPHRLSTIARQAGLDDSTTSRILTSGIYLRTFVRPGRGLYDFGPTTAEAGFSALSHDNLADDEAMEVLQQLRRDTGGGLVFLYMRAPFVVAGRQCVLMAVGDSDLKELGMTPRDVLSVTRSLRTGASGRTILSFLSETVQERVVAMPIPDEAGPGLIRDNDAFVASLAEVRDVGYALGRQECMANWNSVAAPVIWHGHVQGAVLMLKTVNDMPQATQADIDATVTAASRLSVLGGTWPTEE